MDNKKYFFELKMMKERSTLVLKCDEKILGKKEWEEGRDMGRRLFEGIAELLKENNLEPKQISDMVIDSEIPENYTSMRIAETVKKVYTFGVTSQSGRQAQN